MRKKRSFQDMNDEDICSFISKRHNGETITELSKSDAGLYHAALRRNLVDRLVRKNVLLRTRNNWGMHSDEDIIKIVSEKYHGKNTGQIQRIDASLSSILYRRGLVGSLIREGILVTPNIFKNDSDVIKYVTENYSGKTIADLIRDDASLYGTILKRHLADELVESGILKRQHRKFESDRDLIKYVTENHKGKTLKQIKKEDPNLIAAIHRRELTDRLVDEGILMRTRRYFRNDEEVLKYIAEHHSGKTIMQLLKDDNSIYDTAVRRNLIAKLIQDNILVRQRYGYRTKKSNTKFLQTNNTAKRILSLASVTEDTESIADLLVKLWPDRFPNAAELARMLPRAVEGIGHSLQPFSLEQARSFYDTDFALPKEVRYSLDQILFSIALDQYQAPFNKNPKKTLKELRGFASEENGVSTLAKRVLESYRAISRFGIPGYGRMEMK